MTTDVRSGAIRKISLGGIGLVAACALGIGVGLLGYHFKWLAVIVLALPGAYALVGLLELTTGVPFVEISDRWDQLQGWHRGVIGLLVVAVVAVALIGALGAILPRVLNL